MPRCDLCGREVDPKNDVVELEKYILRIGGDDSSGEFDPPIEMLGLEFYRKDEKLSRHLEPEWSEDGNMLCRGDEMRMRDITSDVSEDEKFVKFPFLRDRIKIIKIAYGSLKYSPVGRRIPIKK